jgi:hypothetical protein
MTNLHRRDQRYFPGPASASPRLGPDIKRTQEILVATWSPGLHLPLGIIPTCCPMKDKPAAKMVESYGQQHHRR